MLVDFDPVLLQLGPVPLHWYALLWLVGAYMVYRLSARDAAQRELGIPATAIGDLVLVYGLMGAMLGGRIGYILFYGTEAQFANLGAMVGVVRSADGSFGFAGLRGLSFHGGLLGVICASWIFARRHNLKWPTVIDLLAVHTPIALGLVRVANFINGELYGRITDVPWAMVFAGDPTKQPRHPSQLYEAFFEGLVLGVFLYYYSRKPRAPLEVSGAFAAGYGGLRFLVEFTRAPDAHIGFEALNLTRGQWFSLVMFAFGVGLWFWARHRASQRVEK